MIYCVIRKIINLKSNSKTVQLQQIDICCLHRHKKEVLNGRHHN